MRAWSQRSRSSMLLLSMAAALAITKPDVASGFATRAFTAPSGLVGPVAGLRPGYAISARMPRCDWAHFLGRMSVRQQAGNLGSTTSLTGLGVGGSAVPPKQAITGTRMMTTASMPIGISMERLTNQYVLLSMATICLLWITTSSQAGLEPLFVNGILAPFLKNVPIAIACFGSADIVTQAVGAARNSAGAKLRWDKRQTLAACCVGVVLNAFGLTVWLHYLNELIPMAAIALPGLEGVMNLLIKAFTHSTVWGMLANTVSLILRRIVIGDSPKRAVHFWHEKIMPMMAHQMCFWPAYQIITFAFIPAHLQVMFSAMGSFFFNVIMFTSKAAAPIPSVRKES